MSTQHEVTTPQNLLDSKGHIAEPGYAKSLIWNYSRDQIKAPKWRIKEWDYYLVVGKDFAVALTVSDLGYIGMMSVSLLNFAENWAHTNSIITPFPMGSYKMPTTSAKGDVVYSDKHLRICFVNKEGSRRLVCKYDNLADGKPFECDILLEEKPMDSMVIATPWSEKPDHFYYNQKINSMPASGTAKFDGKTYTFDPATDFGTLDWGRGVWTYDNRWYWSSGNQRDAFGNAIGFNLGYGFTDRSSATENMFFFNGVAHKLDEVKFEIPLDEQGNKDYMSPWKITSNDGRFEADFTPILDRRGLTDLKVIITDQHQVFGKLNGVAKLDDGTPVEIKDMLMFAEDVRNKY